MATSAEAERSEGFRKFNKFNKFNKLNKLNKLVGSDLKNADLQATLRDRGANGGPGVDPARALPTPLALREIRRQR